jgi:hypothetical protein
MAVLFDQGDKLLKEVWVGQEIETQTMVKRLLIVFHKKIKKLTRSWPLDWRDCFG